VTARLARTERGVAFADVVDVLTPSPDRRPIACEARCGGNVFSHIDYARQLTLKGEIIQDAFARIGRLPLPHPPEVMPSAERGYRMRARLHVSDGRIGFYVEGTHRICDAASTGQLLPDASEWIASTQRKLSAAQLRGLSAIEIAENVPADQRACHLELHARSTPSSYRSIADGLVGLSAECADRPGVVRLAGTPIVTDTLRVKDDEVLSLSRDVRAFFQGNRFLIKPLVDHVSGLVPTGPVIDLYAGVGLFGLSMAAQGRDDITAIEGDHVAGADLIRNAEPFGQRVRAIHQSVEAYLAAAKPHDVAGATIIVDPPRTGISKDAIGYIIGHRPPRLVYVSCDVATLARDTRALYEAGYTLSALRGIDLFPNTAHVESVAVLTR
jgi:23S rRNA (uracil1939-C5)-methyltransferase